MHYARMYVQKTYEIAGAGSARGIYALARARVLSEPARTATVRTPAGAPVRRDRRKAQQGEGEGQHGGSGVCWGAETREGGVSPRPAPLLRRECMTSGERKGGGDREKELAGLARMHHWDGADEIHQMVRIKRNLRASVTVGITSLILGRGADSWPDM